MRIQLTKQVIVCILIAVVLLVEAVIVIQYTSQDGFISERVISKYQAYVPKIIKEFQDSLASTAMISGIGGKRRPFLNASGGLDLEWFQFKYHENVTREDQIARNKEIYGLALQKPIKEPKVKGLHRSGETGLANATLFSLVRNSELKQIIPAIRQVEMKFNNKFHYPWSFLNDEEFSEEFKREVQKATKSKCYFETIPAELWNKPDFIDPEKQQKGIKLLKDKGVQYADKESYRNMCRFNSGLFYNTPHMSQFKWYWRVEPKTRYFCEINYDVFKFMEENDKTYGFVIGLYDNEDTVKTLWTTTLEFLQAHPDYIHPNGAFNWILEDMTNPARNEATKGYSTCHFWSNFEIANLDFFRSQPYTEWFEHLDRQGGFYYERFGDAPVHSLGLSLFEDRSKVHWFRDIGYFHFPYNNCPNSEQCGGCKKGQFSPEGDHLDAENCLAAWIQYEMDDTALAIY